MVASENISILYKQDVYNLEIPTSKKFKIVQLIPQDKLVIIQKAISIPYVMTFDTVLDLNSS